MKRPAIRQAIADLLPHCEHGHTLAELKAVVFPERSAESVRWAVQEMLRDGQIEARKGAMGREFFRKRETAQNAVGGVFITNP